MTRVKEVPLESREIPKYKSYPSRVIKSLRIGYNNLRRRIAEKAEQIKALKGTVADLRESRDSWKQRTHEAEAKISELESQISGVKKKTPRKGVQATGMRTIKSSSVSKEP